MKFEMNMETPALILGYGYIPEDRRGVIHSTPEADRRIRKLAMRGPAKMGRTKKK